VGCGYGFTDPEEAMDTADRYVATYLDGSV
jgi:hypothetical protein